MTHPPLPLSAALDAAATGPLTLVADGLTRFYGDRAVLRNVSLTVAPGHRVGLVGENGIGKSTLLRLLGGQEEPDRGAVHRPADLGMLHQETPFPGTATVDAVVAEALARVRALEAEVLAAADALDRPDATEDERATAEAAYARALSRADSAEIWDADRRAERTLAGLGVDHLLTRTVGAMSGGERTRLGLATLLIRQPAALLLDEPTNHLDDDAAGYLARAVAAMPGAVVLASHDRDFLEEVCTEIFDLDPTAEGVGGTLYGGAYSDYRRAKREERAAWGLRYEQEQIELKELRGAVSTTARAVGHNAPSRDKNKMAFGKRGDRVESQVSRRVRNAQLRLDTLERDQVRRPPRPLVFRPTVHGLAAAGGSGLALSVRDLVVEGRVEVASFDLAVGAHLLITGPNGSGKSTLLHALAGDLRPARGSIRLAPGIGVGLLEQDVHLDGDDRSPRALFDLMGAGDALVGFGLVARRDLDRPLRELSTGQRRRVVLGMLVAQAPEVLLLDEPTNHISLTLAEELGEAIEVAPGAVVVASHDRWLRRTWRGDRLDLPAR